MATEETITKLISASRRTADDYRTASERLITQPAIAHFFEEQADYHEQAASWLESKLASQGKSVVRELITAPDAEGWTHPASTEFNPKAIIRACHESEELTAEVFEQSGKELPEEWQYEINGYIEGMRSTLAKLHGWLDNKEIGPEFGR